MNLEHTSQTQAVADENLDVEETQSAPRRDLLAKAGLAGLALLGGRFAARADHHMAGDKDMKMQNMNGAMPGQMVGMAKIKSAMTQRDEMGIPKTAVVRAADKPGIEEQNDAAILNYALTLEHLEAEFYTRVVQADDARPFLQGRVRDFARVLMRDEVAHVVAVSDAIRKLGGTPVAKPNFVFPNAPFVSHIAFLEASSQLEETGVSAYLGQGANVRRKDVLNFAASIYGIEARHSGLIRYYLGSSPAIRDMELPLPMGDILQRVRPFFADPAMLDSMMPSMMNGNMKGGMMDKNMMPAK